MFLKNKYFVAHLFHMLYLSVYSIKFYEDKKSVEYDCNVKFEPSKEFTCACINGVWKIYKSECEEINTVGGLDYCFELPTGGSVTRAEKILGSTSEISIRFQNGTLLSVTDESMLTLDSTEIFTTGVEWTFTDSTDVSSCLSPTKDNFCQFSLPAAATGKFIKGCLPSSSRIVPKNCDVIQLKNDNICEKSMQAGRVFLVAPGMNKSTVMFTDPIKEINETDEDYYNKTWITESRDEISTEIWNFIDEKLDDILQLNNGRNVSGSNYSSVPLFHILQLANDVMKRTCPDYYVKPQFFDMATYAFIEMQKKAFKQEDYPTEFYGYRRIVNALKNCSANAETFPFFSNYSCDFTNQSEGRAVGRYYTILNGTGEISTSDVPTKREPIIETAWKIFFNAHSTCFSFFDDSYNDHHRFTTWITPLFQNNINDVWKNSTSNNTVFGNMFGDMFDIQSRIAYCTTYAKISSEYPWDLPIPDKSEPYTTPTPPVISGRRKRSEQSENPGQCITPIQLPKC